MMLWSTGAGAQSNDSYANAIVIANPENYCSGAGAFTNLNATSDGPGPPEAAIPQGLPAHNVWFKFQATSSDIQIELTDILGSGQLERPFMALFDENMNFVWPGGTTMITQGLQAGSWYYLSVDNVDGAVYSGSFGLCFSVYENVDFKSGAKLLSSVEDYCSAQAEFTTSGASADGSRPSDWQSGPNYNVWFKFQAVGNTLNIDLGTNGSEGTIEYAMLALYDASDLELASEGYRGSTSDLDLSYSGLTLGDWYYISVDNRSGSSYKGTFTLCVDNYSTNYLKESAHILPFVSQYCSSAAEFSNQNSVPDGVRPSNWQNGPNYNVWFKFQAIGNTVEIDLGTGSSEGTMEYAMLALSNEDGGEFGSVGYGGRTSDRSLSHSGLTAGDWYYISVDSKSDSYRGTFTLCVDNYQSNHSMADAWDLFEKEGLSQSNVGAIPDGSKPVNWPNGPNNNIWYKFQSTGNYIELNVMLNGLTQPMIALFDDLGQELESNNNALTLQFNGLVGGEEYLISVDNNVSGSSGAFTFSAENTDKNYLMSTAQVISDVSDYCSTTNEFRNTDAIPDGARPSNWQEGPNNNVWYKFQAHENFVHATMTPGTLDYGMMALFDQNGLELSSAGYSGSSSPVELRYFALQSEEWYYLSIDSRANEAGSFSLCVQNVELYDQQQDAGVIEVIGSSYCSENTQFTTKGGTGDGSRPNAWDEGPNSNVWFKFQAKEGEVDVRVEPGTLEYAMIALMTSDGEELKSVDYYQQSASRTLHYEGLTIGDWYLVTIDSRYSSGAGTFDLCIDFTENYDFKQSAYELPSVLPYYSGLKRFTTSGADNDGPRPVNWQAGPYNNVWFKFVALVENVKIEVRTGADEGTIQHCMLALYDDQETELASAGYRRDESDNGIHYENLIVGNTYYLTVDNKFSETGTFTLFIKESNDFQVNALEISNVDDFCSLNGEYSNIGATKDGPDISGWLANPVRNVWFKFQAQEKGLRVDLKTGAEEGSMEKSLLALWDEDGQVLLDSEDNDATQDKTFYYTNLGVGEWYYLSIDSYYSSSYDAGTFTLCLDNDPAYSYQSLAVQIPDISEGYCSPAGSFATNQVVIAGTPVNSWLGNRSHYQWFKFQGTDHNSVALSLESETLTSSRFYFLDEEGQVLTSNTEHSQSSKTLTYYNEMVLGDWYYVLVANGSPNVEPFTLCISPFSNNDTPGTAQIITNLDGSFSQPFTTAGGTPDGIKPDEWSTGPHHNVWFKFQADDLGARIKLVYADNTSDLTHTGMLALWDSQLQVKQALGSGLGYDKRIYDLSLQPGEWYYVSVDQEDPNAGDFVLSVKSLNVADSRSDALDVTAFILSPDGYPSPPPPDFWPQNNKGATPDGIKPEKWVEEPFKNIWFKFQATNNAISITVDELSNLEMPMIALYEAGGGELASQRSLTSSSIVNITWNDLIVGDWYEITVDGEDFDGGRFTLGLEGYNSNNSFKFPFIIDDPEDYTSRDELSINDRYFTTSNSTYDGDFPESWEGNPNVWFAFQAVENTVMIKVSRLYADDVKLALLDSVGNILSVKENPESEATMYFSGLDLGDWYYLSVSSNESNDDAGDFRLDIESSDRNWSMLSAIELPVAGYYASSHKEFNNLDIPSSFPGEDRVWFKFKAVDNGVTLEARTYGDEGDAQELGIGLTNAHGEVLKFAINGYSDRYRDIAISYGQLVEDSTYYFYVETDRREGTFSLRANTFTSNDNIADAFFLNDSSCVDMEVSAVSIDGPIPPNWGSGRPNVWFKFWASDEGVRLTCDNDLLALHDTLGNVLTTAVGELAYFDLVPGQLYYLNVGMVRPGNITVCMESLPLNDSPAEAYDITYLRSKADLLDENFDHRWIFSSEGASPDRSKPSNWQEGPNQNTWFKMVVPHNRMDLSIDTRELSNPLEYGMLALYNDQLIELTSVGYDPSNPNNRSLGYVGLTPGGTYYLSVDHRAGAEYSGRFSLIWSSCNQSPGFVPGSIGYSGGDVCIGEPFVINSVQAASGSIGTMRYGWERSTVPHPYNWKTVSSNTGGLSVEGISQTTWYRRKAQPAAECTDKYTNVISVNALGSDGGEITEPGEICYGDTDIPPLAISTTIGSVDYYEWEVSTVSEESGFVMISDSNYETITPDPGPEYRDRTWYRRNTHFSNGCSEYSNVVVLVVNRLFSGQIGVESNNVCLGQGFVLNSLESASHSFISPVNVAYSWQKSTVSAGTGFESISGSGISRSVSSQVESTAWYRRVAYFNGCEVMTQAVQLNVIAPPPVEATEQSLAFFGPQEVTLSVVDLGYDYEWYETETGGNILFTGNEYTYHASESSEFYVQSVDPSYPGCPNYDRTEIEVKMFPLPVIESTANVIYDETGVDLQANYMDYETFSWNFNGREIGSDPTITVFQPGSYTLTVSTHGLSRSTSIDISSERVLWAVRDGDWNDVNIWSFSKESLPPVTLLPGSGDVVMIDGQLVAVSGSETCKEIYLSNSTGETELVVMSTGSLTVHGDVKISKSASNPNADVNFRVEGNGLVECVPME